MASHGIGAAAGSDAPHAEVVTMGQTNPSPYPPVSSSHHSWSSATGSVSWNNTVDKLSQDTVYYDPQRDVSVSGGNQNVGSSAPHVAQASMGITDAAHSHVPYSSSDQHGYNPVEYANYYYSYPQAANDSSVQQGANQHPGAAYQPLTSFQNSGSYIDPTSNTYYNAGDHQTVPGYGSSSYYFQNNTWNGGSTGNNFAQSYQNYSPSDTNAQQSSTSVPANSLPYQQQYNQWPYYYNQSVPSASSNPVAGNSTTDNLAVNTPSSYSYPNSQPPPPGTTSWKSNSSASVAPPMQVPGVLEHQNQYGNQAEGHYNQGPGVQWSQNHYAYQTQPYPQKINSNYSQLSNPEDQLRTVDSNGPSTNLSSNHVSENFKPNLLDSVTMNTSSESKIQVPINPRIAQGFSMVIPKNEKKSSGLDLSRKPAYVSVSMPANDAKASQVGPDARSIPFSLRNYAMRNLNRCKNDTQRAACRSIMEEITKKAFAEGTLLTKNWDTEPLFPLPESVVGMAGARCVNSDLSPFLSVSTPRKRVKSRWEPVVDENVTNKVEQIAKGLISSNVHSTLDPKNRIGSSWDRGKFLQSCQASSNKVNQRPAKKQKMASNLSQIQNGSASSDSEKEHDLTKHYASATALANSPEEKKRREHRSKRFEKSKDSSLKSRNASANNDGMASFRARRAISSLRTRTYEEGTLAVEDMDWDALTVKGTCQEIEKRYLRLTEAPDPAKVRPEDVLEKALAMVETSEKNYLYKCDQLKSIRQDLTVQRIQNELTVKVYETHARLAMQAGDLPEFNQCQSQLKRLYAQGIKGCYFEFSAYNLLCVMLHSNNKRDLLSSMASLSKEAKQDAAVKHSLAVHASVLSCNYVQFFKLYKKAPNLNSCLMDLYVERMRFEAMKCMSRSYRPTVPVGYVAQILGFLRTDTGCATNGDDGLEGCEKWLKAHGTVLSEDSSGELQIDTKASSSTLYMPEPENAVAHGDASLAVDDFFARTDGQLKRGSSDGPTVDTP
ncbi:Putative SAC3/GANP family protein [Zea mays]|uniref:Putative SAC3/GANP family protein n=2 Tax=Zea mays TaxID=4577 RepID=A0A1D6FRV2_MAIZE|nr:Putative SAC3/GANP family protein [Zea mays]